MIRFQLRLYLLLLMFQVAADTGQTLDFEGKQNVSYLSTTSGSEGMTWCVLTYYDRIEDPFFIFKNEDGRESLTEFTNPGAHDKPPPSLLIEVHFPSVFAGQFRLLCDLL